MRWTRIQCDHCMSDTLAPEGDPVLRGWKHDPVTGVECAKEQAA
jgi:hypothetical protein